MEGAALSHLENVILGDINFHLDVTDTSTTKFLDILQQFSFLQIIDSPTELICVSESFRKSLKFQTVSGLSDHLAVNFDIDLPVRKPYGYRRVTLHKIHKIDINAFRNDISNTNLIKAPHKSANLLSHLSTSQCSVTS